MRGLLLGQVVATQCEAVDDELLLVAVGDERGAQPLPVDRPMLGHSPLSP
jgi:hypothetical protein